MSANLLRYLKLFIFSGLLAFNFFALGIFTSIWAKKFSYASSPYIAFNEAMITNSRNSFLDLNNPDQVFAFVFSKLPKEVTIYPTENYYYFSFLHQGQEVRGNIRLGISDRDQDKLSFAYYGGHSLPEKREDQDYLNAHKYMGSQEGILLSKIAPLKYRVEFRGKEVLFNLNELSQTIPENFPLLPDERFVARTFDESGWQFILLYDSQQKQFRFVVDPTAPRPDVTYEIDKRLYLGRLTLFAFFQDSLDRLVLVGVNEDNVRSNSYADGPFDQLADNYVKDDSLQRMMEEAYPYVRGRINTHGIFVNNNKELADSRLALTPYSSYDSYSELRYFVKQCQSKSQKQADVLTCLTYDYKKDVPASEDITKK